MLRIIIHIDGGLVQAVYRDADVADHVRLLVVDTDADDPVPGFTTTVTGNDGHPLHAVVSAPALDPLPTACEIRRLVDAWEPSATAGAAP